MLRALIDDADGAQATGVAQTAAAVVEGVAICMAALVQLLLLLPRLHPSTATAAALQPAAADPPQRRLHPEQHKDVGYLLLHPGAAAAELAGASVAHRAWLSDALGFAVVVALAAGTLARRWLSDE